MIDEKFMRMALKEAEKGVETGQKPYAACLIKDGKVFALGHNTVNIDKDVLSHGETNAIRSACKKMRTNHLNGSLREFTMYTTCEPCPLCFGACKWAGIKRIYYGISLEDLPKLEKNIGLKTKKHITYRKKEGITLVGGVCREKCLNIFISFGRLKNR